MFAIGHTYNVLFDNLNRSKLFHSYDGVILFF